MHDHLDNSIKSRQPTGDEVVDMLNNTRPVGRTAHRDELEERLLAQLQSNNERFSSMQAVHSANILSLRKFPAILAATLVFLLVGGTLMIFNAGNGPGIFGASQATQTPDCNVHVHNIRSIDFLNNPVNVYSRDDEDSEIILSRLLGWDFDIMGTNRDGDWIMFLREDGIVGWIHLDALDEGDYTIRACIGADSTQSVPAPPLPTRNPNATVQLIPRNPTPTATPVIVVNETPLDAPPGLGQQIEAVETLSIYASDDTESDVLQELEPGDHVEIIGQNYNREWIIVRLEPRYAGWVAIEDADKFMVTEGSETNDSREFNATATAISSAREALYNQVTEDSETGEGQSLDATATPILGVTPFPPTAEPPDEQ